MTNKSDSSNNPLSMLRPCQQFETVCFLDIMLDDLDDNMFRLSASTRAGIIVITTTATSFDRVGSMNRFNCHYKEVTNTRELKICLVTINYWI